LRIKLCARKTYKHIDIFNTNAPNNIFIGKYSLSGNYYFDGIIDDIRVYNRSLNDNEISSLYHEGGWGN